jgi:BASS family bile acid:Na+ symporter
VVFVGTVIGVIVAEHDRVLENLDSVAAAAIALNITAMTISFWVARLARLDDRQSTAIAMELGVHNTALAIAVAATVDTELTIPAAVYASFMFVSAGLFARLMYLRNGPQEATAAPYPSAERSGSA